MPYLPIFQNSFLKDVKGFKNNKKLSVEVDKTILSIIENPLSGALLLGSWAGFRKVGFFTNPQYRLVYFVYDCCSLQNDTPCIWDEDNDKTTCNGVIDFAIVGTREKFNNLYSKGKSFSDKFRRDV